MALSGGNSGSGERRGRGRPAAAVLRSEADFTDPDLSRERRWLALFLLVHLVDEHGRMSTAYRRILKRAAREPGHWAQGRSLGAVRAEVNRWIGVQARAAARPPWDRIADVVDAAVPPKAAPDVLATARYLYDLATGEPADDADRPHWLDPDVGLVTTSVIGGEEWVRTHSLPLPAPGPRPPEPPDARPPESPRTEPEHPSVESGQVPVDRERAVPGQATTDPEQTSADPEHPIAAPEQADPEQATADPGQAPVDQEQADQDPEQATGDSEWSAYTMLWTVVRAHRAAQRRIALLENRIRELHEENARLSGDVTSWLGDYRPAIPDQERRTDSPRPVSDRHLDLASAEPAEAFTYRLPAELPGSRTTG